MLPTTVEVGWFGMGRTVVAVAAVAAVAAAGKEPAGRESVESVEPTVFRHRVLVRGHTGRTEHRGCSSVGICDWPVESEESLGRCCCTFLVGHSWSRSSGAGKTSSTSPAKDDRKSGQHGQFCH